MNPAVEFVLELLDNLQPPRLSGPLTPAQPLLSIPPLRQLSTVPLRIAAIGGLPPVVRERFGLRWSRQDQLQLDRVGAPGRPGVALRAVPDALAAAGPGRVAAGIGRTTGGLSGPAPADPGPRAAGGQRGWDRRGG